MIAQQVEALKALPLVSLAQALDQYVHRAAGQSLPAHEVELGIWKQVLAIGHAALGQFFQIQGSGDLGPSVALPTGQTAQRLDQLHNRDYRSVFGDFVLPRTVYG